MKRLIAVAVAFSFILPVAFAYDDPIRVLDTDIRRLNRHRVGEVRFSWKIKVRNLTPDTQSFFAEIGFFDNEDFMIHHEYESVTIDRYSTQTLSGMETVTTDLFDKIKTIKLQVDGKWYED